MEVCVNLSEKKAEIAAFIKAREAATPGEWNHRESSDVKKISYVFIRPGYFFWPQVLDNEITRRLNVTDNSKQDADFICLAANTSAQIARDLLRCLEFIEEFILTHKHDETNPNCRPIGDDRFYCLECQAKVRRNEDAAKDFLDSLTNTKRGDG